MRFQHLLVGLVVLGAACSSDSNTEPTVGASGSLSFNFTGAGASGTGSFSASGAVPANIANGTSFGSSPWAAGASSGGELDVAAVTPVSSSSWNLVTVSVAGTTTGTYTINSSCTASTCTEVGFLLGTNTTDSNFNFICTLTTGSVVVTSINSSRAAGTFSGSGTCSTQAGSSSPFTITNGTFDVGLTATTIP